MQKEEAGTGQSRTNNSSPQITAVTLSQKQNLSSSPTIISEGDDDFKVLNVLGYPSLVDKNLGVWYYGNSYIEFDDKGKVKSISNEGDFKTELIARDTQRQKGTPSAQEEAKERLKKEAEDEKRQIEAKWSTLGMDYQEFHGFRIYPYPFFLINEHYEIYNEKAEWFVHRNDYKCVCEWKTNKLLELLQNPNLSKTEKKALSLEYRQLTDEYFSETGTQLNSTQGYNKSSKTGKVVKGVLLAPVKTVWWTFKGTIYTADFLLSFGPAARKQNPGLGNAIKRVLLNSTLIALAVAPGAINSYQTQKAETKYNNAVNDYNQTVNNYNQRAAQLTQQAANYQAVAAAQNAAPTYLSQEEAIIEVKRRWASEISPGWSAPENYGTDSKFTQEVDKLTGKTQ